MFCRNCGKEVDNDVKYCPNCGFKLSDDQQDYYQPINQGPQPSRAGDAPSLGFACLSFFFPIVGLILFIVWHNEYPLKAKSCLNGFIASIVLGILVYCCVFSSVLGTASEMATMMINLL